MFAKPSGAQILPFLTLEISVMSCVPSPDMSHSAVYQGFWKANSVKAEQPSCWASTNHYFLAVIKSQTQILVLSHSIWKRFLEVSFSTLAQHLVRGQCDTVSDAHIPCMAGGAPALYVGSAASTSKPKPCGHSIPAGTGNSQWW